MAQYIQSDKHMPKHDKPRPGMQHPEDIILPVTPTALHDSDLTLPRYVLIVRIVGIVPLLY